MGGTFINKDFVSIELLLAYLGEQAKIAFSLGLYLQSAYIDSLGDSQSYNLRAYFSK